MAGSTSSLKIKVEGLSQFKQNITTARTAVKTYDSELKLNEAQLKAGGDASEYAANKARILQEQLKEQEKIAGECEKALAAMTKAGVDPTTQGYQKMRQQMLQAQTAISGIKTQLGTGTTAIKEQASSLDAASQSADTYGGKLDAITGKLGLDTVSSAINGIASGLESAIKLAIKLGKAMWDAEVDASTWADELNTTATAYGVDTTTLQQWEYAANFVDTNVDDLLAAHKKIVAARDSGDTLSLLEGTENAFKVSLRDEAGELRDTNEVMWDVLDQLNYMYNNGGAVEAEQAANELFGRGYDGLMPLIKAGRDTWEGYMDNAPTLSEDKVQALQSFNDAYEGLTSQFDETKRSLLADFAGSFETLATSLTDVLTKVNEWANSDEGKAALQELADAVTTVITSFVGEDGENLTSIVDSVTDGITGFAEAVKNFDATSFISGLQTVIAVVGSLKLGLMGLQAVNAFKLLFGGGSAAGTAGTVAGTGWGLGVMSFLGTAGKYLAGLYGTTAATIAGVESAKEALGMENPGGVTLSDMVNVLTGGEATRKRKTYGSTVVSEGTTLEGASEEEFFGELESRFGGSGSTSTSTVTVANATSLAEFYDAMNSRFVNMENGAPKGINDQNLHDAVSQHVQQQVDDYWSFVLEGMPDAAGVEEDLSATVGDIFYSLGNLAKQMFISGAGGNGTGTGSTSTFNVGTINVNDSATGQDILQYINFKNRTARGGYGG